MARKSREEINAQRRAKYAAGRAAGLTRDQLRSVEKAAEEQPGILETITNIFAGLGRKVTEGVQDAAGELLGTGDLGKAPGKGKASSTSGMGGKGAAKSGGSSGGGKGSGGSGKKPPSFEKFAKRELAKGKSGKQIEKEYRKKGGSISHENSQKIIRDIKGQPEKESKKVTKFRDETGKGTIKGGVRYYKSSDLRVERVNRKGQEIRTKFTYIKAKYGYVVRYQVMQDGRVSTRYATVASDKKLDKDEVIAEFEDMYGQASEDEYNQNRYNPEWLVDGSVQLDYVIERDSM